MANPLAKPATVAAPVTNSAAPAAQYRDVGYVGVGFEHVVGTDENAFKVVNLSFDRDTDFGQLAAALASGKMLTLRNRKEDTRRVGNMSHNIVLREKVA